MIKIKITKNGPSIAAVEVSGHAGYAAEGSDIVCAGVSAIVQSAQIGLLQVLKLDVNHSSSNGHLQFTLPQNLTQQQRREADVLLDTMQLALSDLEGEYKKFIKLEVN